MATAYFQIQLLEIGQKEKEATINTALQKIDDKACRYLGDLSADPVTTGVPFGSTFFNTTSAKLRVLRANGAWVNAA